MRRKFHLLCVPLVFAACGSGNGAPPGAGLTSPSIAGLERRTIGTTHVFGDAPDKMTLLGPINSVVGPGVELRNFGVTVFISGQPASGFVDIDFSNTTIVLTLTRNQTFGYFDLLRFSDADGTTPDFTTVTINPVTNYAGFGESRLRVEPDMIDVNLTSLRGLQGQQISLNVNGAPARPSP